MSKKRCCENCVYSGKVRDGQRTLYICSNVPGNPGQTVVVPPDGLCPHFRAKRGQPVRSEPKESGDPRARYIPLTDGLYARVDAGDYAWLSLHKWSAYRTAHTHYAYRRRSGEMIYMHQEIMVPAEGYVVDISTATAGTTAGATCASARVPRTAATAANGTEPPPRSTRGSADSPRPADISRGLATIVGEFTSAPSRPTSKPPAPTTGRPASTTASTPA